MDSEQVQQLVWEQVMDRLGLRIEKHVGDCLDGMWGDCYSFEFPLDFAAEMAEAQAKEDYDEQRV
jgi:hypothetical protein